MLTAFTTRRHLIGSTNSERRLGVVSAIVLSFFSIAYLFSYEVFRLPETLVGFYIIVAAGTLCAGFVAYQRSGLLVSCALTLGSVSGAVVSYWRLTVESHIVGAPIEPPWFVYGFNAFEFWIPLGLLLGTVAYWVGVSLRRVIRQ